MDPGGFARTVRAVFKNLPGKGKRAGTRPQAGDPSPAGRGFVVFWFLGRRIFAPAMAARRRPGGLRAPHAVHSPMPQKPQSNRIETTVRRVPQAENGGRKAVGKRSDRGAAPLLLAYPFFPALSRGRRIFNRRFDHWISPASARESSGSGSHGNCVARGDALRSDAARGGTVRGFCPATVFAARFRLHFAKPAVRKGRGKERRRETIEREEEERERKRGAEKRPRFRSFTLRARGAVENFFGGIKAVENCFPGGGRTGFIRCPD